jgi:hypothetical protein
VHITIPAECHVRHVQLDIATPEFDPASPLYAESLRVRLGETVLYEFCGTGYGSFGRQDRFTDGSAEFGAAYQREGRVNGTTIRMPTRADVQNATFELECTGGAKLVELLNISGGATGSMFGDSAAYAGDLDGDGYGDVVIGDQYYTSGSGPYTGRAVVYFGGGDLGSMRTLNLTGSASYSYFGSSVAGAGDVNGDGCDDLLVGAFGQNRGSLYYAGAAYLFLGGPRWTSPRT